MTPQEQSALVWSDALLAAALFAVDPVGLGGVVVRAGPGPARELWLRTMQTLLGADAPVRRVPARIEDDRLLGGLDLSATLAAGRPVVERGVLAACDGGVAILAMAERMEDAAGARIAAVLDSQEVSIERDGLAARLPARIGLIALDEGLEPNERPPDALLERLAFWIDLNAVGPRGLSGGPYDVVALQEARRRLARPPLGDDPLAHDALIEALCRAAEMVGLLTVRPPLLALRAARAHAALAGRTRVNTEDAAAAVRLVLSPRALSAPDQAQSREGQDSADADPEPPSDAPQGEAPSSQDNLAPDADQLIEAIQAALPEGLLDEVNLDGRRPARSCRGQGSGAATKSIRGGRPTSSRAGALRGGDRLNLPDTLRAATPWQKLRSGGPTMARIQVRQEDFRICRFVRRQEATTIFLVDASGSAAFQRLAEAKGAVERLLAKAYVSRARVALIAFRNFGAEVLLEPTRSLTRAKRSLAELPGGGGTPLAAGLDAALRLAQAEEARDRTPLIVILTDGQTNISRSRAPGRPAAESDAMAAARSVREAAIRAVFIDTSPRPRPDGDRFAKAMGALYAPLPYMEAAAVSGLVDSLLSPRR